MLGHPAGPKEPKSGRAYTLDPIVEPFMVFPFKAAQRALQASHIVCKHRLYPRLESIECTILCAY